MRFIPLLFTLGLYAIVGCSTSRNLQELNANCCKSVGNSFAEGRSVAHSKNKTILTIVLSKTDQNFLKDRTCLVLGLTEKKDRTYLNIIERDFVIVKLSPLQFRNEIDDSMFDYKFAKEFVDDALESEESFAFISNPQNPIVYGPTSLNEKEQLKDLIWVKFGP